MNDISMPVADASAPATELTLLATENPVVILTDQAKFDAFYERVKKEVEGHVPDLATDKGRKAIASLAFKVVKTKTALDDAGKRLTEDKRREIAAVDAARKTIRDKLDDLRDEVRRPLTEWEAAEEARVERCQAVLARLKEAAVIRLDDTSEGVERRLASVEAEAITETEFGDVFEFATDTQRLAVEALTAGRDRLAQEEADRAELARLRQESEERAAREAAEAEERRRREAQAAQEREREEADRQRAEQAERERAAAEARAEQEAQERADAARRAAEEAAEQARAEAQRRAQEEQDARDREHREEVERVRRESEERAQAAEAQARRLSDERDAQERQAAEAQAAADARARDIEHRGTIMRAAKEALMEHVDLDEPTAKKAVLAIGAGSIPHVSIAF